MTGVNLTVWLYTGLNLLCVILGVCSIIFLQKTSDRKWSLLSKLPLHETRFFCHFVISVISILQIGEIVIFYQKFKLTNWEVNCAMLVQCFSLSFMTYCTYVIEKFRKCKPFLLHVIYSLGGFIFNICLLVGNFKAYPDVTEVKNVLILSITVTFCFLFIFDAATIWKTKNLSSIPDIPDDPGETPIGMTYDYAHILSQLTCFWMGGLVSKGRKKPLEEEDLYYLPKSLLSSQAAVEIKRKLQIKGTDELLKSLLFLNPLILVRWVLLCVVEALSDVCVNICIYYFVKYASSYHVIVDTVEQQQDGNYLGVSDFFSNGFNICILLWIAFVSSCTLSNLRNFEVLKDSVRVKAGLQALIFEKTLRLHVGTFTCGHSSAGKITNLCVTDVEHVRMLLSYSSLFGKVMFKMVFGFVLLYFLLGQYGLIIICTVCVLPIYTIITHFQTKAKRENLIHGDRRLKITSELVSGMRFLKLQDWQEAFARRIEAARADEMKFWTLFYTVKRIGDLAGATSAGSLFQLSTTRWEKNCCLIIMLTLCLKSLRP